MPGANSQLHERMAWLIAAVGGQAAAAPIAAVSKDTVNNLRKPGWKVPLDAAVNLCRAVGVSLDWLATGLPAKLELPGAGVRFLEETGDVQALGDYVRLLPLRPVMKPVKGKPVELWSPSPIAFDPEWLTQHFKTTPDQLRYAFASDDGMAPGIPRNALLLVDAEPLGDLSAGDYVVDTGGDLLARRLNRRPDGVFELVAEADLTWRYELAAPNPSLHRIRWCSRLV